MVETKRDDAKLLDRTNYLIMKFNKSRTPERLAWDRVQRKNARVKAMKERGKVSDSKYLKTVENAARAEGELCTSFTSLVSKLKK